MEVLDLRGLKCPLPALLARRALARIAAGGKIEIVSDDPLAAIDVPHMCSKEGHEVLAIERFDAAVRIVLRRGETFSPSGMMLLPILMMLAAPFIGSFLGALAIRIPEERPVLWARSQCETCGHVLSARELVPLASFVWLRGRCASCRAPIGAFPLVMELAALAVVAWAALQTSGPVFVATCVFGWALLLLAAIDWRLLLLPDVVTLPLVALGLLASFALPLGAWRDHVIGAAAGFVSLALIAWLYQRLRKREGLGLGDAKLSAAIGAWVGWQGLPTMLLWGSMLGLMFAIALSLRGMRLRLSNRLPFGVFLAAGGWLVWLYGPLALTSG